MTEGSRETKSEASQAHPALCMSGVSFGYANTQILHSLDLIVERGVTGVLGTNGAGKTTLLRIAATALRAGAGTVSIEGADVQDRVLRRQARRSIGYMPQMSGFPRSFTVHDLVAYSAWLHKVPRKQMSTSTAEAIERADLTDRRATALRELSGGMLRRAFLAQAIVHQPKLLILDEPTAGLDPQQRLAFRRLITSMGEDSAVLFSTHQVDDIEHTADQVRIVHDGRVTYAGSRRELELMARDVSSDSAEVFGSPLERAFATRIGVTR